MTAKKKPAEEWVPLSEALEQVTAFRHIFQVEVRKALDDIIDEQPPNVQAAMRRTLDKTIAKCEVSASKLAGKLTAAAKKNRQHYTARDPE